MPSTNGYEDARHYHFKSTMPVNPVCRKSLSGGENIYSATRSAIYGYDNRSAIYNAGGRGFQGFRKIVAENGNLLRTTTTHHQKFPLTGKVASVERWLRPIRGHGSSAVQTETEYLALHERTATPLCPGDNQTALPVLLLARLRLPAILDRQQVQNYDLGTGAASSHVDTVNATASRRRHPVRQSGLQYRR